ncbi:hypothetical protein CAT49_00255 [Acinetobacter baumannii]|uniref:Uncharacterized protein n=1 Tax=Acinetobacter baumannii 625974 TaxID=1310607 RepID=A0A009P9B6_ACIBA|nr:hypothetical protein [Acinetobacter baumannii]EXC04138.1 hypothetical protein J506_3961 [Acinetobacter baumannii 625974]EXC04376.1 hypothetical protein J506_3851 [Acinetobacter baumannii 625974]EXC09378.1 hypothetical protein J506_0712 [Acinetobacter baumannii 625974]OTR57687.1 hypothetical protein CAT49_00255 [Acinetobacter baumannii]
MDNYKIKVNDEAESKEAQELFFELGYSWLCCGKYYNRIGNYTFITAYPDEMLLRMGWGGDTDKELTLPQLRDLVVLKRNDVKDANHTYIGGGMAYKTCEDICYLWSRTGWEYKGIAHNLVPIQKHLESATGRFDENGEHHLTFSKGAEEKDPALISGADAELVEQAKKFITSDHLNRFEAAEAHLEGHPVQFMLANGDFIDITSDTTLGIFEKDGGYSFRLKPQTIKLELELPKPFEPKLGDLYWFISPFYSTGYDHCTFTNDSADKLHVQYGAYRSEDDVKKAVDQLRKIRGAS